MKIARLLGLLLGVAGLSIMTGCTLYTQREVGPQQRATLITSQASFDEVLKALGAPDEVFDRPGGASICVYHSLKYTNVLSLYSKTEKSDLVMTFVDGRLIGKAWVPTGTSMSIIAGQTYTLSTDID